MKVLPQRAQVTSAYCNIGDDKSGCYFSLDNEPIEYLILGNVVRSKTVLLSATPSNPYALTAGMSVEAVRDKVGPLVGPLTYYDDDTGRYLQSKERECPTNQYSVLIEFDGHGATKLILSSLPVT